MYDTQAKNLEIVRDLSTKYVINVLRHLDVGEAFPKESIVTTDPI